MARKQIKVGVKEGQGPPPGYEWNILILDFAFRQAMGFLQSHQYKHLVCSFRNLRVKRM